MLFYASTYADLNQVAKDKVILLPLGAIEQHGPHLSVSTDTDIVTQVAQQIEKILPDVVLLLPDFTVRVEPSSFVFWGYHQHCPRIVHTSAD